MKSEGLLGDAANMLRALLDLIPGHARKALEALLAQLETLSLSHRP